MRYQPIAATALTILLVGASATAAHALDWDGGGAGDTDWSNTANWNPDAPVPASTALVFATGGSQANFDLAPGFVVGAVTLNKVGGFNITHQAPGEGFALAGDLNVLTAGYAYALDVPITVTAASSTWTLAAGDQLGLTEPLTLDPASVLSFATAANAYVSVNAPLNGGEIAKTGSGALSIISGGTVGGLALSGGAVYTQGIFADMDVVATGGTLSGGSSGNTLCAFQQVGSVDLAAAVISPGDGSIYGLGVGYMCLSGSFDGNVNSTFFAEVDGPNSDTINSLGTFDANDTTLDLITITDPAIGTVLTLAEAAGGIDPGVFLDNDGDAILDGAVFESYGEYYRMDYRTVDIVVTYLGDEAPVVPAAPVLPPTGVDTGTSIVLGGFLLLAGAGAIMIATRRRENAG